MKATIDIPDALYRRVKAKSAMEGRPVREVAVHLFQGWIGVPNDAHAEQPVIGQGGGTPTWFGAVRKYAQQGQRHDLASIRRSIAQGRVHESRSQSGERHRA